MIFVSNLTCLFYLSRLTDNFKVPVGGFYSQGLQVLGGLTKTEEYQDIHQSSAGGTSSSSLGTLINRLECHVIQQVLGDGCWEP